MESPSTHSPVLRRFREALGIQYVALTPPAGEHEDWISSTFDQIMKENEPTNDGACLKHANFMIDPFPYEDLPAYALLQERLAATIPPEHDRANITLRICGRDAPVAQTAHMRLIGGMGPLADARSCQQLIAHLLNQGASLESLSLWLHSFPPPRRHDERGFELLAHGTHYAHLLRHASIHFPAPRCVLLSNTAHVNAGRIKRFLKDDEELINLVKAIAANIVLYKRPSKLLILGTTKARDRGLYPEFLRLFEFEQFFYPEEEQQHRLQQIIDDIKSAQNASQDRAAQFESLSHIIGQYEASHILLACTELPLFLAHHPDGDSLSYLEILRERYEGTTVLNSEDMMITSMAEKLQRKEAILQAIKTSPR